MSTRGFRGVHIFWIIAGFFAVTFTVNTIFIVNAVTSFPGEEVPKSYLQGLEYNTTLERRAAQAQRGWTAQVGVDPQDETQLVVRIVDRAGAPVSGLQMRAHLTAAAVAGETLLEALREAAPGEYRAALPAIGLQRHVRIEAHEADSDVLVFEARKALDKMEEEAGDAA